MLVISIASLSSSHRFSEHAPHVMVPRDSESCSWLDQDCFGAGLVLPLQFMVELNLHHLPHSNQEMIPCAELEGPIIQSEDVLFLFSS